MLFSVVILSKDGGIRCKADQCSITVARFLDPVLVGEESLAEFHSLRLPLPRALHVELGRKSIHCLDPYPIEPDRLFKCFGVVFRTGIHFGANILYLS